jgi:hypothetical protein
MFVLHPYSSYVPNPALLNQFAETLDSISKIFRPKLVGGFFSCFRLAIKLLAQDCLIHMNTKFTIYTKRTKNTSRHKTNWTANVAL